MEIVYHRNEYESIYLIYVSLDSQDYSKVIKVFNEKNIAKSIGHYIGLQDKDYCTTVIALLHSSCRNEIINALSSYLPTEIPR